MKRLFLVGGIILINFFILSCKKDNTDSTACIDADGHNYNALTIGSQVWMAENLKTTKYRNGDLIETTIPSTLDISGQSTPKYQWAYDGEEENVDTYGRLYTWYAATDSRGVCPAGWHVPSSAEWTTLTSFLGGESSAGGKLKEVDTLHWYSPNTGATNETGFTALPGGQRNSDKAFNSIGIFGCWWSSTASGADYAWHTYIGYDSSDLIIEDYGKRVGFSVRCLQD